MLRRFLTRALILGLGALAFPLVAPTDAAASVSIAVGFENLVKDADAVAVITPGEHQCVWEDGKIITYTKVHVDQGVAGDVGGADTWVRTRGGVVGQIGQLVDGEPVLTEDKPSLLFLRKFKTGGIYEVSARAQGQYPLKIDEATKAKRIVRAGSVGMILPPKNEVTKPIGPIQPQSTTTQAVAVRLALEVLHDKPLDDMAREIATTWKRLHLPAK